MANPVSYLIFFLVAWAFFNFIESRPKVGDIVGKALKYVFSFIWPIALLFGSYVYVEKNETTGAFILGAIALALTIPCTVIASDDPGKKWSEIKKFFHR
ncbi:TPA: hypothetical protein I8393_003065 [Serratia marcescens]|uniref:hypothetical protein n=1 Tax=Serratia TaxID=613 RepID=UPI001A343A38|nr:hypothetical protein [Serratia marcescens]MDP8619924.1 hypothetical protein [Serratia marcescens]HAT2907580.1 hypothetical protein [Serratia marcescens]